MMKYKAKIEYIEQLKGYIVLVNLNSEWCRCGTGSHSVTI